MTRFDPEKKIAGEKFVLKALNEEKWVGYPVQLRALAYHGEELRQRYENECSYAWAGNSDFYREGTKRLAEHILKLAKESGLSCYLQGDCRGATVYVRALGLPIDDNAYSTQAQCLYYLREEKE